MIAVRSQIISTLDQIFRDKHNILLLPRFFRETPQASYTSGLFLGFRENVKPFLFPFSDITFSVFYVFIMHA